MQKGINDMIYDVARVKKQLTMIWHTMMDQARTYMDMNFDFWICLLIRWIYNKIFQSTRSGLVVLKSDLWLSHFWRLKEKIWCWPLILIKGRSPTQPYWNILTFGRISLCLILSSFTMHIYRNRLMKRECARSWWLIKSPA